MHHIDDMLAAVEAASETNDPNLWEMSIDAGVVAAADEDGSRFAIGELACRVRKAYGKNSIADWAKSIKRELPQVQDYRTVVRFWGGKKSICVELLQEFPNLSYSHLKLAKRLRDIDKALEFLHECSAQDWTVEKAGIELDSRLGKPKPPRKLIDGEYKIIHMSGDEVTFQLDRGESQEISSYWFKSEPVRLVIYEAEIEPGDEGG